MRIPGTRAESYALFERLGVGSALRLVANLASAELAPEERLASVFERLLRLTGDPDGVVAEVVRGADGVVADGEFGLFAQTARELGRFYPGDPGVLAALLMNRIVLHPNDAIFLPAGNLHAYLRGGGVEVMANSDNVMRGGLTPKHIDVDELLSVLDFTPGFAGLIQPTEEAPGLWRYPVPAPEFALWRIDSADTAVPLPATDSARISSEGLPHPALLAAVAVMTEVVGGASLILGTLPRVTSVAMIVFTIAATVTMHRYWEQSDAAMQAEKMTC